MRVPYGASRSRKTSSERAKEELPHDKGFRPLRHLRDAGFLK
jgi:hypothetical protein